MLGERLTNVPRLADGTLLRVLERLLVLDGERLSYRALDVLLGVPGRERAKWLKEHADCELPAADAMALAAARDVPALLAALQRRVSPFTPQPVPLGALVLSPTEERRRSGSHYTPRELTEPIVATTLRPILEAFDDAPTPEQLLGLRICDPAVGSGAFLVGACRYLGERLVESWQRTGTMPAIPPDEDPQLFARRLVAQRCLFGVDRNPFAVQLAKLSLWLVSLVGLTRRQIEMFPWDPKHAQVTGWGPLVADRVAEAVARRGTIEALADPDDTREKLRLLGEADEALHFVRLVGDAAVAAFFAEAKPKAREQRRQVHEQVVASSLGTVLADGPLERIAEELRASDPPVVPFHWEIEFPEVFARPNAGFDAIVGNPPFAGKNTLINGNAEHYLDWLQTVHVGAHGNADLVAHFFRRAFGLLRDGGAFGLIATNTIAQGDTRATGLRWIRQRGGTIYEARRRYRWPGVAAVVVSVVHAVRGPYRGVLSLDGRVVERITAFLFHAGGDDDPAQLPENAGKSFIGSYVLGMGFTFDDDNEDATPIAEMHRLIAEDVRNAEVIFPYIGGEEVNNDPTHAHRRYVINLGSISEDIGRRHRPALMRLLEAKARGKRGSHSTAPWWQLERPRLDLYETVAPLRMALAINCGATPHLAVAMLPARMVFSHTLAIVALDDVRAMCVLQSRLHETWARFFSSSMKDDLRYTPSDSFETFPFPVDWHASIDLERIGREYYDYRAQLMIANDEGLTATYNRFNDRDERDPGILKLRELHDAMDRAVLDAHGWTDLRPTCEFLLDYEDDEADGSRRKKPWRYRWPDDVRDEVLARLLELNRQRAAGRSGEQASLF